MSRYSEVVESTEAEVTASGKTPLGRALYALTQVLIELRLIREYGLATYEQRD